MNQEAQQWDYGVMRILEKIRDEETQGLTCAKEMVKKKFGHRVCVPQDIRPKEEIMTEAHHTPYTVHPRATNMS